jgi:hypothetical protein
MLFLKNLAEIGQVLNCLFNRNSTNIICLIWNKCAIRIDFTQQAYKLNQVLLLKFKLFYY